MNIIEKPKKYYPHYMLFNRIICAGIPNQSQKFFYTPAAKEKITSDLPAWIFTNEEYRTCPQDNMHWKSARKESFEMARSLNCKELVFADFEARSRILEFINQHKYPFQQGIIKPFQEIKTD